jgi:hypothetical protein
MSRGGPRQARRRGRPRRRAGLPLQRRAAAGKAVSAPSCAAASRSSAARGWRHRGAGLGHLAFQRAIPGGVAHLVASTGGCARASPFHRSAHPRHGRAGSSWSCGRETAPPVGALDPEPVHARAPARRCGSAAPARPAAPVCRRSGRRGAPGSAQFDLVAEARTGEVGAHLPADGLGAADDLLGRGPAQARPGDRSETASIRLVLPAPLGPKSATGRPSRSSRVRRWLRKCDRVRWATCGVMAARFPRGKRDGFPGRKAGVFGGNLGISGGPSHAHRHHDVDRAQVSSPSRISVGSPGREHEHRVLAIHLAGDFQQVFRVEADLELLVAIGHGQFFLGGAASGRSPTGSAGPRRAASSPRGSVRRTPSRPGPRPWRNRWRRPPSGGCCPAGMTRE